MVHVSRNFGKNSEYSIFKLNHSIFRMSVARTREGKSNKIGIVAICMEAHENRICRAEPRKTDVCS